MPSKNPIEKRKCCFCLKSRLRKDLVSVTKNKREFELWTRKLGETFRSNCDSTGDPRLCLSHFPPEKLNKPRSKILPYKNGTPRNESLPNNCPSDPDSEEDSEPETEDDQYDDLYEETEEENDEESFVNSFGENRNLLCDMNLLLPSLSKCWQCLRNHEESSVQSVCQRQGAAISISFHCIKCNNMWIWKSSGVLDRAGKPGKKQFEINLRIASSISTTGNGFSVYLSFLNFLYQAIFQKVDSFCRALAVPIISKQRFHQIMNKTIRPAIEEVYQKQRTDIMSEVKENAVRSGGVDLSGDGQFDSRGYSAVVCRFSLMDVKTNCIVDFETCRKQRGGNSILLEKEGHQKALPRILEELKVLTGLVNPVRSFTSDRCVNLAQVMMQYPTIHHYFDSWHWIRSIRKDIREKYSTNKFIPMRPWVQRLINHIHFSIEAAKGDGEIAWQMILSFFYHVQGQHDNFQAIDNIQFDLIKECSHPADKVSGANFLDLSKKEDKNAFDVLWKIMTKENRRRDLGNVSPFFSTSALESFHSLAATYLPKENFFDKDGYDLRSKLAILHWNELQTAEASGIRTVQSKVSYYCKTKKTIIWKNRKTKAANNWRSQIFEKAKKLIVDRLSANEIALASAEIDARALVEQVLYAQ